MKRTDKIIEKILRPEMERYKNQEEEFKKNHHKYYTTLEEIMVSWLQGIIL